MRVEYVIQYQRGPEIWFYCADVFGGMWSRDVETAHKWASKAVAQKELERQFRAKPNAVLAIYAEAGT